MRLAGIVRDSIVDGPGIRDVIFVQGCGRHCEGCHNKQTWDYDGGEYWSTTSIMNELSDSSNDITISGGEPLDQFDALLRLLKRIRYTTNKRVWLYTGNTMKEPISSVYKTLFYYVDVIVDGHFIEELKDPNLLFRGSSNQRIIDLNKSVKADKIIEWEESE